MKDHKEDFQKFVESSDINLKDDDGLTQLMNYFCHTRKCNVSIVKSVLENPGFDPTVMSKAAGSTLVMFAVGRKMPYEVVEMLLEAGAKVNHINLYK